MRLTPYIAVLKAPLLGYTNVQASTILNHIVTTYGEITQDDLAENIDRLESAWDPVTPFESLVIRANECRDFAAAGNDPITDAAMLRAFVKSVEASGVLVEAIKDWRKKPTADRTWANVVPFFRTANKE